MWRRALRIGGLIAAVLLVALAPRIAFRLAPAKTLRVVILDKTVPFHVFREHAAIPWLLHSAKIQDPSGRYLDPGRDYVGFDPGTRSGRPLSEADLAGADVLVCTDTYGVYRGDYEASPAASMERTPRLYGGLDEAEAKAIADFAARDGMVIAEFNTFASPTEDAPRARLEALFGVRWTRWVARYWPDLADGNEVPAWLGRLYQKVTGKAFDLKGPGLVFIKDDADVVVLRPGEDLGPDVVSQLRTPAGAAYGFPPRGAYWFWMDVVEPTDGEVLYEHVVDVTEGGAERLRRHGLPVRFPAFVKRRSAYYFAGDFVDNTIDLGDPERFGLLEYRARTAGCGGGDVGNDGFFWGFYAPIVTRLLSSRARAPGR